MRQCNICKKRKKDSKFKHDGKKTCSRCEFRWKKSFLRLLVQDRRLSAKERIANRLGYMGTAFISGIVSTPQVWVAKQWNLVAVNLNVMIGYLIYLISNT